MMKRPLFHIKNCQLREKIWLKSVHKQGNWALVVQQTFKVNSNIGFGIPIKFPSQRITANGIIPESLSSIGQF